MAMTLNEVRRGSLGSTNMVKEESSPPGRCMHLHSGLSALIEAATSQLGHLAEASSNRGHLGSDDKRGVRRIDSDDDDVSSDDGDKGEKADHPARTPTMVPEPDPRKQSFPELLMTLALEPSNVDTIAFLPDGKFFAIRANEFTDKIMVHYFAVTTFEEFLDLANDWGFSRLLPADPSGIEVFRHPHFIKGEWDLCSKIKFGESPTDVRVSALPERAKVEYLLSDDPANPHSKRRLSPGFLARRESESSVTSQKMKIEDEGSGSRRESAANESEAGDVRPPATAVCRLDDFRSIALSITAEKLNIKQDARQENDGTQSMVDRAVNSATHAIVADAIEGLLRDESHTKQTYLKHEKELSKSSLPGVVPISKQLFSSSDDKKPVPSPSTAKGSPSLAAATATKTASVAEISPSTQATLERHEDRESPFPHNAPSSNGTSQTPREVST